MAEQVQGSFRLFQVAGINVYLHWSWLLVAYLEIQLRKSSYENPVWNVLEYLSIFGIVLVHEFGHALACRSVGGLANRIVLWPLGGVAFVSPPPRPGAVLWSIAAGPLVNVVLVPVTIALALLAQAAQLNADVQHYTQSVAGINLLLLIFNMLPIYPLDGGQILQSLLWFVVGRAKSLMFASVLGLVVSAAVIIPLLWVQSWWSVVLAIFIGMRSWAGIQQARLLGQLDKMPRHQGLACPFCKAAPVQGVAAKCPQCGGLYDVFDFHGICPACQTRVAEVVCLNCARPQPLEQWYAAR
jgi:Zn-dependent protease